VNIAGNALTWNAGLRSIGTIDYFPIWIGAAQGAVATSIGTDPYYQSLTAGFASFPSDLTVITFTMSEGDLPTYYGPSSFSPETMTTPTGRYSVWWYGSSFYSLAICAEPTQDDLGTGEDFQACTYSNVVPF
jgi:hypothetical protein